MTQKPPSLNTKCVEYNQSLLSQKTPTRTLERLKTEVGDPEDKERLHGRGSVS